MRKNKESGYLLVSVSLLLLGVAIVSIATTRGASVSQVQAHRAIAQAKAEQAADAGLEHGMAIIRQAVAGCVPGEQVAMNSASGTLGDAGYNVAISPASWTCPSAAGTYPLTVSSEGCADGCGTANPGAIARVNRTAGLTVSSATAGVQGNFDISGIDAIILARQNMNRFNFANFSRTGAMPDGKSIKSGGNINYDAKNKATIDGTATSYDSVLSSFTDSASMFAHYFGQSHSSDASAFYEMAKAGATPFGDCGRPCTSKVVVAETKGSNSVGNGDVIGSPTAPVLVIIPPGATFHLSNSAVCHCILFNDSEKPLQIMNGSIIYGALVNSTYGEIHIDTRAGIRYSQAVNSAFPSISVSVPSTTFTVGGVAWQAGTWERAP